jgi:putative spermidine/putrescine transport system ATP-binding protein
MQVELKQIQQSVGITFVFVTHDQGEALSMSDRVAVFNQGRVEQVGTPAEVYEHPVNEFVAGFVGAANFVASDAGPVTVRPERVRLDGSGEVRRAGVVEAVHYLGPTTRVRVVTDDGTTVLADVPNSGSSTGAAVGDRVDLSWRRDDQRPVGRNQPDEERDA